MELFSLLFIFFIIADLISIKKKISLWKKKRIQLLFYMWHTCILVFLLFWSISPSSGEWSSILGWWGEWINDRVLSVYLTYDNASESSISVTSSFISITISSFSPAGFVAVTGVCCFGILFPPKPVTK